MDILLLDIGSLLMVITLMAINEYFIVDIGAY
jgi:hypothetical protein